MGSREWRKGRCIALTERPRLAHGPTVAKSRGGGEAADGEYAYLDASVAEGLYSGS